MHNTKTKQEKIQKPLFHAAVHQPAALRWLSRPARGKKEGWLRIEAVCSSALSLQGSKQFFFVIFLSFCLYYNSEAPLFRSISKRIFKRQQKQ